MSAPSTTRGNAYAEMEQYWVIMHAKMRGIALYATQHHFLWKVDCTITIILVQSTANAIPITTPLPRREQARTCSTFRQMLCLRSACISFCNIVVVVVAALPARAHTHTPNMSTIRVNINNSCSSMHFQHNTCAGPFPFGSTLWPFISPFIIFLLLCFSVFFLSRRCVCARARPSGCDAISIGHEWPIKNAAMASQKFCSANNNKRKRLAHAGLFLWWCSEAVGQARNANKSGTYIISVIRSDWFLFLFIIFCCC